MRPGFRKSSHDALNEDLVEPTEITVGVIRTTRAHHVHGAFDGNIAVNSAMQALGLRLSFKRLDASASADGAASPSLEGGPGARVPLDAPRAFRPRRGWPQPSITCCVAWRKGRGIHWASITGGEYCRPKVFWRTRSPSQPKPVAWTCSLHPAAACWVKTTWNRQCSPAAIPDSSDKRIRRFFAP